MHIHPQSAKRMRRRRQDFDMLPIATHTTQETPRHTDTVLLSAERETVQLSGIERNEAKNLVPLIGDVNLWVEKLYECYPALQAQWNAYPHADIAFLSVNGDQLALKRFAAPQGFIKKGVYMIWRIEYTYADGAQINIDLGQNGYPVEFINESGEQIPVLQYIQGRGLLVNATNKEIVAQAAQDLQAITGWVERAIESRRIGGGLMSIIKGQQKHRREIVEELD